MALENKNKNKNENDDIIPKKMHFIWVGGALPDEFAENIRLWKQTNPDYEVHIWIDLGATDPQNIKNVQEAANKAAQVAGGVVHDLATTDKHYFDNQSKNMDIYNEELTGQNRNLAAASDILRLEILYREGGIYIDTDLPPKVALGNIHAPLGFVKSTNFSNDFLCASPGAELTDRFRDKIAQNYANATSQEMEFHRNKRPWKSRTETTLDWTGPDMIKAAINDVLQNMNRQESIQFAEKFQTKVLLDKFIEASSQTWRDKGPENREQANVYFKEELNFRMRFELASEVRELASNKNAWQQDAFQNLANRLENSSETTPIPVIIKAWKKENPRIASKTLDSLSVAAGRMHDMLGANNFTETQIEQIKKQIFPKQRYDIDGKQMNGLENGVKIKEAVNSLSSNIIPAPIRRPPSVLSTFRSFVTVENRNKTEQKNFTPPTEPDGVKQKNPKKL